MKLSNKVKSNMNYFACKVFLISLSMLLMVSPSLYGESETENYQQEIEYLLNFLEKSGCDYIRNGKRHSGKEARKHVEKKYRHFEADIASAEEFVEKSATKSLLSGKKYYVQCVGQEREDSAVWMLAELKRYRETRR